MEGNMRKHNDFGVVVVSILYALFVVVAMQACATITVDPQTTDEKVVFYRATLTGIYNTTADYTERKLISKEFASTVLHRGSQVETMIDLFETSTGELDGRKKLAVAINQILIELNNELIERGRKK